MPLAYPSTLKEALLLIAKPVLGLCVAPDSYILLLTIIWDLPISGFYTSREQHIHSSKRLLEIFRLQTCLSLLSVHSQTFDGASSRKEVS